MSTMLFISSGGFFVCLILLVYFITKYRQSHDQEFGEDMAILDEVSAAASTAAMDAKRLFTKNTNLPASEVLDMKDKLKELHYKIEELKLAEEKRTNDLAKVIAKVEERISTFENEYVNKLQPTLFSLISELENIQKGANK